MKTNVHFSYCVRICCACLSVLVFSLMTAGCGMISPATPTITPTETATSTPIPTDTPTPTNTPTSTPTSTPTPDRTKEAAATATQMMADRMNEIVPELEKYGFSAGDGALTWISDGSLEITADTHWEENFQPIYIDWIKDFVLQTEVSWDTSTGWAGCAVSFRVQPDLNQGTYLWFPLMRLQAAPAFDIEFHEYGQAQSNLFGEIIFDNNINDDPGSSNTMTIVAQGNKFTPYINGKKYRTVQNNKVTEGEIYFSAWQESGDTVCTFENGWLFVMDPLPSSSDPQY